MYIVVHTVKYVQKELSNIQQQKNYTDALAEYWLSYPLDGDENLSLIQSLTQSW